MMCISCGAVRRCRIFKALASTTVSDGMYYEITYNGDKMRCILTHTRVEEYDHKGVVIMSAIDKLIQIANAEVGYLEKSSNSQLDSKTANAGTANYTKYWRDIKPEYQGQPWCA